MSVPSPEKRPDERAVAKALDEAVEEAQAVGLIRGTPDMADRARVARVIARRDEALGPVGGSGGRH